ncbi:hypothetical protein IEQ34_010693 [Dendrobium chrysotoxum]|uniref:Glycosyltransferase n=1 Tax=Dendrobium chrysotoxum TaxID=161865 RepID=A0AAV7GVD5_DENCH|nr:hypothetical protein IEQ34_010693 [Dendrobium chrysotoxum]
MADTNPSPHVVVVASPGMGHVTPLAGLAKLLVLRHHLTATLVTFSDLPACSLPSSISTVQLPIPLLDDLPPNTHFVTRICQTIAHSVSPLREILITLRRTTRIAAVIFDLFGSDFLSMVKEFGIPSYLFITSNYFFLSFMLHLPTLDETTSGEFRNLSEPLRLPGCVPLNGEDFLEPIQERESEVCSWVVHISRNYDLFDGTLVNSFEAIEADAAKFYKKRGNGKPHVWPIGPLTWSGSDKGTEESSHKCIEWLNRQSSESVVFICFGSAGTLSLEQTQELALGLDMSGQRFIWVVRVPNDTELISSYFNPKQNGDDCLGFLPEGFVERTKDRGMMVRSWGPQREVLSHYATAGFVSHCGWNSTLESLVNGVPMIAWPLYAEQRMNEVLLVEGVKVALKPKAGVNGVVRREEVAKVVKELMEGEEGKEVRRRMQEMKEEAARAVVKEGSSYKAIEEMVSLLKDSVVA